MGRLSLVSVVGMSDQLRPGLEGVRRKQSFLGVVASLMKDPRLRFAKATPSVLRPRYPVPTPLQTSQIQEHQRRSSSVFS